MENIGTSNSFSLGDLATKIREVVDPSDSKIQRYVAGGHMVSNEYKIVDWGLVGEGFLGPAFNMKFSPGDVLYGSRRTYLRKVAKADFEGICSNTTFVLRANSDLISPDLLPHILQLDEFVNYSIRKSKGSTNPYVNWKDLASYTFTLPEIKLQRTIAEILDNSYSHYHSMAKLLLSLNNLRKELIVDLFQECELDPSKGSFLLTELGDCGELQIGRQRAPKYLKGVNPLPYLRSGNIFDGEIDFDDILSMDFNEKEIKKYKLERGDILINEGGSSETVGRAGIFDGEIPGDCCFQNTLIRFRTMEGLSSKYALIALQWALYTRKFEQIAQTTSIAHIGIENCRRVSIPIPLNQSTQDSITKRISELDQKVHETEKDVAMSFRLYQHLKERLLNV